MIEPSIPDNRTTVKSRSPNEPSLPRGHTQFLNAVLGARQVSPTARCLWGIIKAHCIKQDYCWPSLSTLSFHLGLGLRQTKTYLYELEEKGFLEKEARKGKQSLLTPILPKGPVHSTARLESDPSSTLHDTRALQCTTPVQCTAHEIDEGKQIKEVDEEVPPSAATPQPINELVKTKAPKSKPLLFDPEFLKTELDKIDPEIFRKKYGDRLDVDTALEDYSFKVLNGTGKAGQDHPNPWNTTDFLIGFHTFCRNCIKWENFKPLPGPGGYVDPGPRNVLK